MKQTITTPEQLSLILQSARKRRGLTQSDLASSLDLSQASLSRPELNTQNEGPVVQGTRLHGKDRKGFVERADLLNRPLRTRTVGGVGGDG